jgi:hypothetical protein
MPADLRAAFIQSVQTNAGVDYRATLDASGRANFEHPTQKFVATIDAGAVHVKPSGPLPWRFSLSTSSLGCSGEAGKPPVVANVLTTNNRVRIDRDGVHEWYVHGPLGLEQGFTVDRAPDCRGTKVVSIAVNGNVLPRLDDADRDGRGQTISLLDHEGTQVARYTDLYVKDARGKRVAAWFGVTDNEMRLHWDDTGAVYPMEIDPLLWTQQAKLVAGNGVAGQNFGLQVALDGTTALVAAPLETIGGNAQQGAVYVFTYNGTTWSQQQKLVANDGQANDNFGSAVSISGTNAFVGAPQGDGTNANQGAAYVFTSNAGNWSQQQKITAGDGLSGDGFGGDVFLSGTVAVVGASTRFGVSVFV